MSSWLQTEQGFLNLATAQSIADLGPIGKGSGFRRWRIIDAQGNPHNVAEAEETLLDVIASSSPVVPGSGREQLIELWADPDHPQRVDVVKLPIVGWRYFAGQALPLAPGATVCGQPPAWCMQLVEFSDGRCVELQQDGGIWDDLAAASDAFVKRQADLEAVAS
jgi:hypothetical protein